MDGSLPYIDEVLSCDWGRAILSNVVNETLELDIRGLLLTNLLNKL